MKGQGRGEDLDTLRKPPPVRQVGGFRGGYGRVRTQE